MVPGCRGGQASPTRRQSQRGTAGSVASGRLIVLFWQWQLLADGCAAITAVSWPSPAVALTGPVDVAVGPGLTSLLTSATNVRPRHHRVLRNGWPPPWLVQLPPTSPMDRLQASLARRSVRRPGPMRPSMNGLSNRQVVDVKAGLDDKLLRLRLPRWFSLRNPTMTRQRAWKSKTMSQPWHSSSSPLGSSWPSWKRSDSAPGDALPSRPDGVPAPDLQAPLPGAPGLRSAGAEKPGARAPPAGEAPPPPAGGPPSNPPAHRPVLLHAGQLAEQRTAALHQWHDLGRLHSAARTELQRLISVQMNAGAGEPGDVSAGFPWPQYVATHPDAADLVGPGIVEFGAAAVAGTRDPNRGGWPRVDFVIHRVDGSYVRIHPGRTPKNDAIPRYFPPADGPAVAPGDRWRYLPPHGFTWADAQQVPATDRLTKKIAWAVLESLPEGPLDSGPDAAFKWWLWLGNLGSLSCDILGAGVVSASLSHEATFVRHLVCERSDGSQVTVALSLLPHGGLGTQAWCTRPPA